MAEEKSVIKTKNEGYGFSGSAWTQALMAGIPEDRAGASATTDYDKAAQRLVKNFHLTVEEAVNFLDSRMGRHLADQAYVGGRLSMVQLDNAIPAMLKWYKKTGGAIF